jgi:hypothetical protein
MLIERIYFAIYGVRSQHSTNKDVNILKRI